MIDERVLFLLQEGPESDLASAAFEEAAIPLAVVHDVAALCGEMEKGCSAAVITEDVFDRHGYDCILDVLRAQPSWSEIPLIVLVYDASRSTVRDFFANLPTDIILLEAPIRVRPLLSVVAMAVKARKRQYVVRDTMCELHAARQQAEAATKAKSDFLADMTHDLRTPLSGIMGMLQLVMEMKTDEESKHLLELALRSAQSLLRLINDILEFSRLEAEGMSFERKPFIVRGVLDEAVRLLSSQAVAKGVALAFEVEDSVPEKIVGDAGRVRQVLVNLLGNAVKFTDHGKVWVEVTKRHDRPETEQVLVFSVHDTGIGIAPDKLDSIFGRFAQAEVSTSRKFGGSGLGLAVSKKIVEKLGGELQATSRVGHGSTFTFTLPVENPYRRGGTPGKSLEVRPRRGAKNENPDFFNEIGHFSFSRKSLLLVSSLRKQAISMIWRFESELGGILLALNRA